MVQVQEAIAAVGGMVVEEAIEMEVTEVEEAMEINPNLDSAHYFTGMIELYQGHKARARVAFETALQFNPQHLKAREALDRLETP